MWLQVKEGFATIQKHRNCGDILSCALIKSGPRFNKYDLRAKLAFLSDGAIRALALCEAPPEDRLSELLEKIQKVDTLIEESRKPYLSKVVP